jgi:hypothetical protein
MSHDRPKLPSRSPLWDLSGWTRPRIGAASLSRRAVLRGLVRGAPVALALPTLDAMLTGRARADEAALGPIFGVFFWGGGAPWHAGHGSLQAAGADYWTPTTTGPDFAYTPLLSPLSPHRVSVISGLTPWTEIPTEPDGQSDGHMRGFMVSLTSDRPRSEGFDHPSHTLTCLRPTLEQVVAEDPRFYATYPSPYRSLVLGVSTARFHDYGHWNAISYSGPDAPIAPVTDPSRLYELLFGQPTGDAESGRRARLLDAVLEDAADLRGRLGSEDQQRLDDHLEHLYEVQRRLDLGDIECGSPPLPTSSGDLYTQTNTLAELLSLGLACNITRSFSFMLTSPATTHVFSELGVVSDMHTVCHNGEWESVYAVTSLQMSCFAAFLDHLSAAVDPTGRSILDRALVYGCSEYGEGYQHSVAEMPIVLAGGANGALNPGVHVREVGGNLSSAHLTILRAIGLETESFGFNGGETTDDLPELLA